MHEEEKQFVEESTQSPIMKEVQEKPIYTEEYRDPIVEKEVLQKEVLQESSPIMTEKVS